MKKLVYLLLLSCSFALFSPGQASAQVDSACQVFGTGGTLTVANGTVKRFYTKYIPGAIYGWSAVGSNAVIVGPRNLHYVDVQGAAVGTFSLCVSYSVDGQTPCCVCVTGTVVASGGGGGGGTCCINYINSTYQSGYVKVKFQTCAPGVVQAKLLRWTGVSWVVLDVDNWGGTGYNPAYTYNMEIYNISCSELFCLKICGYMADGTECCSSRFAIRIDCDLYGNTNGVTDVPYGGCDNSGGGGGGGPERVITAKEKLTLSPNPASSNLQVTLPEKTNAQTLQFTNRSGTIVKTVAVNGRKTISVSVSDLRTGNYFIKTNDPAVEAAVFIKE
jgi:hypothetical protein